MKLNNGIIPLVWYYNYSLATSIKETWKTNTFTVDNVH